MGGLPGAEAGARSTAHGTLTIHMPSKGTWAWNSDTMSCHQSRAVGLVKSGKTVNPGHTWRKGQREDQAPQSHGLARLPGGRRAVEVVGAAGAQLRPRFRTQAPEPGLTHLHPRQPPRPWLGPPAPWLWAHPGREVGDSAGCPLGESGNPTSGTWGTTRPSPRAPPTPWKDLQWHPCQEPPSPPAVTPTHTVPRTGEDFLNAVPFLRSVLCPALPAPAGDTCFLTPGPQKPPYLPNQRLPRLIGDENLSPQTLVIGSVAARGAGAADGRVLREDKQMPQSPALSPALLPGMGNRLRPPWLRLPGPSSTGGWQRRAAPLL